MSNKLLIQQYVATGAVLSQHQLNQLSDNLKKSYLRRRLQQYGAANGWMSYSLKPYEIALIDDESLGKYISNLSPAQVTELLDNALSSSEVIIDRVVRKIGEHANPMVLRSSRVIKSLFDATPKANDIYINRMFNINFSEKSSTAVIELLQQTTDVDTISKVIDTHYPDLIKNSLLEMPDFNVIALFNANFDQDGVVRLLTRLNLLGNILLNDNNVIVAAKKIGLDNVKNLMDRVYKKMVDKFGDRAKTKLVDVTIENSKDPEGMKELLKMLGYE